MYSARPATSKRLILPTNLSARHWLSRRLLIMTVRCVVAAHMAGQLICRSSCHLTPVQPCCECWPTSSCVAVLRGGPSTVVCAAPAGWLTAVCSSGVAAQAAQSCARCSCRAAPAAPSTYQGTSYTLASPLNRINLNGILLVDRTESQTDLIRFTSAISIVYWNELVLKANESYVVTTCDCGWDSSVL